MNVIQVSHTDLPGRRFSGYDLLGDLKARGIDGTQVVLSKLSDNPDVVSLLDDASDDHLHEVLHRTETRLSMDNLLYPWGRLLAETPAFVAADVAHYHLLHGRMISLFDLPWLCTRKASAWTLHDAWALTGHCIQPDACEGWLTGCKYCPALDAAFPLREDRADRMWRVKQRVLADLDVDLIVASEHMLDMVRRSPITKHLERVHLIPFGIDTATFMPDEAKTASRALLRLPPDDFVILFRSTMAPVKGLDYIKEALNCRPPARSTTLLTVGRKGLIQELSPRYRLVELGWIDDDALYRRLLSACDVFLMPSTSEGFGLMALEAMAAGRPVICFEGTTLAEITGAPDCGLAVTARDAAALRAAIDSLADSPQEAERRGRLGRSRAAKRFGRDRYLDALTSVYRSLAARTGKHATS